MTRSPDYQRDGISLYLGDCLEILPQIGAVDAVVTDPPYGISEARARNKTRSVLATSRDYGDAAWDDQPCSVDHINTIRQVSQWQVIFGGNYFQLPPTPCWLVWDKQNGSNDFADCELAWTNLRKAVRKIEWLWHGMIRKGDDIRIHPTQKPLGVMQWCLTHLPKETKTVCDPFMGSGTTVVACVNAGLSCIGIEQDPVMFEKAKNRIDAALDTDRDSLWTAKQLAEQQRPLFE